MTGRKKTAGAWLASAGIAFTVWAWSAVALGQPEQQPEAPAPQPTPAPSPPQPGAQPPPPGAYPPAQGAYPPAGTYPQPYGYGYPGYGYAAPPPPPPPPPRTATKKHAEARADDKVALSAGVFLYNVLGIGVGAQLGVFVAPDTLVEGDLITAAALFPDVPQSRSFGLGVRQFATPTFYVRGGMRYRMLRTEEFLLDFDDTYDEYVERTDLGVDFALGNRWQIGSFIIGADWVGIYAPLAVLSAEAVVKHQGTGAESRVDVDDAEDDRRYDVRLAFLQLGASF